MAFFKRSQGLFFPRFGRGVKFSAGIKAKRVVATGIFSLILFLMAGELSVWGEEDYLAKMGVFRIKEKVDAPAFTLPDLTGEKIRLSDYKGQVVMLNFWATW